MGGITLLFLNEYSLHGQFKSIREFIPSLREILKCREEINKSGYQLYCGREISNRYVLDNESFQTCIMKMRQAPDIKRTVMIWISKEGPFWNDSREHSADDYFECNGEDIITDTSLGEAAFRIANNQNSSTVSFSPSRYEITPLKVTWFKAEGNKQFVEILNFWKFNTLQKYLEQQKIPITSWSELINRSKSDFPHLTFSDDLSDFLKAETFNSSIAERVTELLEILDTLKTCFDDQGNITEEGNEIKQKHFWKKDPAFSDESETNKNRFRAELTFQKPDGEPIFCPFHGKIRHRQFRLHFSHPIKHNEPLYIAYIGPKITRN
jgi:hypothetical protein